MNTLHIKEVLQKFLNAGEPSTATFVHTLLPTQILFSAVMHFFMQDFWGYNSCTFHSHGLREAAKEFFI